jgi:hypothetical protein
VADRAAPTAETESAGSYADVSEETLARLVSQITPENSYMIVNREDRPDGYAQTAIARTEKGELQPGRYVVEYRLGPNQHYQAFTKDLDDVRAVLAGWAFDHAGWDRTLEFAVLDLGF